MDNIWDRWKWERSGKIALLILTILTILGRADRGWAGSGLDVPEPIGAYLNGNLPSTKPQSGSGSWALVDAFPGLTFTNPLFMTPLPGTNDLVMLEHQGLVYTFANQPGTTSKQLILDIRSRVQDTHWGGLLSMAFHPQFGQSGSAHREYVYLTYRYEHQDLWASNNHKVPGYLRLSRFNYNFSTGQIDPNSELVMIQQYDTSKHHLGGSITFGNDGFLYLSRGDEYCCNDPTNATQKLNVGLFSGMLRIDVDMDSAHSHPIRRQPVDNTANRPGGWPASFTQGYYIPNDNPWQDPTGGLLEEFYAIGFRSPHVISLDAPTGNIWIADVGESQREEVNLLSKGANFQWPFREGNIAGPKAKPGTLIGTEKPPVAEYGHSGGANCIIGGHIYRGSQHASTLGGKFLFADNGNQKVWAMSYNSGSGTGQIEELCVGPSGGYYTGISGSGRDANGEVYFLKMSGHDSGNGQIMRLSQSEASTPEPPALLSQTGAFSNMATLQVSPGLLAYEVNTPLYSDGAHKQRWFAIPNDGSHNTAGEKIGFTENGNWTFPPGAVLMKHFELPIDEQNPSLIRRMETRFMVQGADGEYFGFTYRWRPDGSEADLLVDGMDETVQVRKANGTVVNQAWRYPSRSECFSCHSTAAGYVLGPRTRQLNRDQTYSTTGRTENQLETLNHLGIFSPAINPALLPGVLTSKPMGDESASWQKRALSYLDSNCSHCHQPGGTAHANFDARLSSAPFAQGLENAVPNNDLGISGARLIAPGDESRSVLYHRANTLGVGAMPPLAKNHIDAGAIALLQNWINTIDASVTPPSPSTSDVTVPTVTLSASAQAGSSFDVDVRFSEAVYGLTADDFVINNGAASGLSGSGASYTLAVAAAGGAGGVSVELPSDRVIDAGSNANSPSNTINTTVASLPVLHVASASGGESSGVVEFTVSISKVQPTQVSVQFTTVAGSADAAKDFQHTNGTLTIPAGNVTAIVSVPVIDDVTDEADEIFSLHLSNASGASIGTASASGTIVDNDAAPVITISDAVEGEGASVVPFLITLSHPSAFAVNVFFETVSGSATGGQDYTNAASTLTFQPGQTEINLGISIARDSLDELDEFFFVRLSAPVNATLGDSEGIGTIVDDDETPALSIVGGTASESAEVLNFRAQLTAASGAPVQVHYETVARSATSGVDFTAASGIVTIPAGATSVVFGIAISNDEIDEADEDFAVNLSFPINAVLGGSSAIGVITDDDAPTALSIVSVEGDENADSLIFQVMLSAASGNTVFVNYSTVSGTAIAGEDFQPASGTLTIPAGQTSTSLAVTISDDDIFEIDETFTLSLASPVNATVSTATATGTIRDNDPAPNVIIGDASASELSGQVDLVIELSAPSNGAVSFDYATSDGTAVAGLDYGAVTGTLTVPAGARSAVLTVPLMDDAIIEHNEEFVVVFTNATSSNLLTPSASVTILDDEAGAQISVNPAAAIEGETLKFRLKLSGPSAEIVSVRYALEGDSAETGSDFSGKQGILMFPVQSQEIEFNVALLEDVIDEPEETFRLILSDPGNATLAVTSVEGTIEDNDSAPTLSLAAATASEGAGEIEFRLSMEGVSSQEIVVNYGVIAGSADASDFQARSGSIRIPAGLKGILLAIPVIDDSMDELTETFVVTLTSATNATIAVAEATGTILDDDAAPFVQAVASSASESEDAIRFQISLSERSGQDVQVDWSVGSGSAEAGTDFIQASGTVFIPSGNLTATVAVPLLDDSHPELDETLALTLTDAIHATIKKASAVGTILDDDAAPILNASPTSVTEGEGDLVFTIIASGAHTVPMTVQVDVSAAVAEAGADFTPVSQLIEFPPGITRMSVSVPVVDDAIDESAETAVITLSAPKNATLGIARTIGIIFDNDVAPTISIADAQASESGNVLTFPVSLSSASGRAVSVSWKALAQSAQADVDFAAASGVLEIPGGTSEAAIVVALLDDRIFEGDETLRVELYSPKLTSLGDSKATGTILDDESQPMLAIDSNIVSESSGAVQFIVSLSNSSIEPITVNFATIPGTADLRDYVPSSGTLTIPAGQTNAPIPVSIVNDQSDEPNENFQVVLSSPSNASLALARGLCTIIDDDAPPAIAIAGVSGDEGSGVLRFPVSLSVASAFTVEVAYAAVSDTAEAGNDFEPTAGTLVLEPGDEIGFIDVPVIDDELDEYAETFSVVLSSPVRARLSESSALGTIEDNDEAPMAAIADGEGYESAGTLSLRVTLSGPSGKNISMDCLTRGDTAVQGVDFLPESGPITIPAGATAALIEIPLIEDDLNEPEETFDVILSSPVNTVITEAIGVGTILDDDFIPSLKIGNASGKESAGTIALPVTMNAASSRRVTFNYVVQSLTAAADEDFVAASGTVVIEPGMTESAVVVQVIDDKDVEKPEQFLVFLSDASNATIEDGKGIGFIGDDDDDEELNETRPRALTAYSKGRLSWIRDPDTGDRFLEYVVPNIPELEKFDVTPQVSSDFVDWKEPAAGDWYLQREDETIFAVIKASGSERVQYVRFVLTARSETSSE
ncbi:MAG: putative repeat protein (TIGR03806 family) [Verrucomicrobiales bacterium]|jgi:uncharacterized repeat protein (TIGR03806 family)